MIAKRFPLRATTALGLLALGGLTATVQLPSIPRPSLPSLPSLPRPNIPSIPNIPGVPNVPNPIDEARKAAARIEELRRQAERVVRDFNRMKEEVEKAQREYERLSNLAQSDKLDVQKEAYRALAAAGVLRSNREEVMKTIDRGLSVVVWGKEFDHFEEQKLATALGASVATANPGPALLYLKKFSLATKAEVLKSLRTAPDRVRRKVQAEFEMLLVASLNAAVKGQRPPGFGIEGVDLTVAMATYNHRVEARLNQPRLVPTEKILGVQLYRIATDPKTVRLPLPNTFQPYLKLGVRAR